MSATDSRRATVELSGEKGLLITREFAAPREHVGKALTTPDLVRRWWHAGRGEVTVAEIDLRVGGRWRYVIVTPDGTEVAFHGEYRELDAPGRMVSTELYEMEGLTEEDASVNTVTLTEEAGRTTMTVHVEHRAQAHRDAHLAPGMEDGMQDAYSLLEEVAASLA